MSNEVTRWEALGTSVVVAVTEAGALASARAAVERELEAIDLACSRFRSDSELTRLNEAAGRPLTVSALLLRGRERRSARGTSHGGPRRSHPR